MLAADDGSGNASFKAFDPYRTSVTFNYTTLLTPPTFLTPQPGQVYTDPQASFSLNSESNPNDSTPLQYEMEVTDGSDGVGEVVDSGAFAASTNWTVPDGSLQNGATYFVKARSYDPSTGYTSLWSTPVPIRIDMREGGDSTQTYDTVGPAKVDLATGNVETSVTSHTTAALGGGLGANLTYNSPIKSSPGLVGSYWNLATGGSGIPSTTPNMQRLDQQVNFNWNSGSPGSGINSTYFAAQWSGYFVAPTTGSYSFGGVNDDWLSITVNGTNVYNNSLCSSGPCFGSSIYLTGGQVVPFLAQYNQYTASDYAFIYVSGPVATQIVPASWFQTGVRQIQPYGLLGKYYTYVDSGSPPTAPTSSTPGLFLTRVDPTINFNWSGSVPITNGPQADWMTQWTGYLTVPASGSYVFGAASDDGSTITVNSTNVYSDWVDGAHTGYGSSVTLTGGQSVPITVDFYHHAGSNGQDLMSLLVEPLGGASEVVPTSWLSPAQPTLPNGWNLGIDPSGTVAYTHLISNTNEVILTDVSGDTYDYMWNGSGYTPPVGSGGFLNRNLDGTYTLQDTSGQTYVFSQAGDLASVTTPTDTSGNASLTYTYGAVNGTGADAVQQITDGVNSNRWAMVYYGGASQCGSPPSGFGSTPANMLCAVVTNDGRTTYFYYDTNGNLAEVAKPGNNDTSYTYTAVTNAGSTIGYEMTGIRSDLANDAIVAGVRANDGTADTHITYDALGRVTSVAEPAATSGASPLTKTFSYNTMYWQSPVQADAGGTLSSSTSPVTVSMGPNNIYMFARNPANSMLIYKSWNGSTWTGWNSLGGCMVGDPAATSWGPNRMDVFVEGCDNGSGGHNLWHVYYASGWGGWDESSTTNITSAPTATSWASGRMDAFANSSGSLFHVYWQGAYGSDNEGGCITGVPTATNWGVGHLDVFAQHCSGSGNNLDQETFKSGAWQAWTTDALHVSSAPSAASLASGQIDLVSTDSSNNVEQATYTTGGGWTGWSQLELCAAGRPDLSVRETGVDGYYNYDQFALNCQSGSSNVYWQTYGAGINTTTEHVTGATEPMGYSELVQYDYQDRTAAVYNNLGQATTTQWDPLQDAQYSTTNPEGLMSTNLYNDLNQVVSQYGPAPASDYTTWSSSLANGASMSEGQSLKSPDGRFTFTFQTNGNLTLNGPSGLIWQSGTVTTATSLTMLPYGNLVEYNAGTPVWMNSGWGPGPSAYLQVQDDGTMAVYGPSGPYWSTGISGYGPGVGGESASGYDTPLSAYASQVARTDTTYDSGATGLSVNYFAVSEPSANNATLTGAPKLHTTNIASDGSMTHDWGSTSPISDSSNWGLSMTGTMRLPDTGIWSVAASQDNGMRMWIDGQLVLDRWEDNPDPTHFPGLGETGTYNNTVANSVHSVRIDYYHLTASSDANFSLTMGDPSCGKGCTPPPMASYFAPNYGLQTSAKSYDGSVGNTTVTTAYSGDAGLGQVASTTVDPAGLNLTSSDTYQTPGAGYGMLTSTTAPGGASTGYSYYSATDTAANPCVIGSPTAYQAGMLKTVTQPSGETVTLVYDDAGNVLASQTNSDAWECRTYDARGRLTQDVIPAFNGSSSRTVTYNYNVGGNPLVSSVTDSQGTITTTIDLLGRTVSYTDVSNDTTTTSYDTLGRLSGDSGPLGTQAYTYNAYNQLTNQTYNSTSEAQPTYDQYGRLSTVTYPTASVTENVGYDGFGNVNSNSYTLHSGEVVTDSDTHSQSGKILTDTAAFGASGSTWSYTYDLADRLTAASSTGAIGSNSYAYSFGSESGSCPTGTNANAGKDGNRTSQTINGVTTTYCYNNADQLTTSSNAALTNAVYDTHGNTTSLGSTGNVIAFAYDSSDRNSSITQGSQSTTYTRDAADRIVKRTVNNGTAITTNYGFTGNSGSFAMNTSYIVTEDYLSLPGGLSLTIHPGQSGATAQTASINDIHGDVIATVDGTQAISGTFSYDPFGNLVGGSTLPGNTANSASMGWKGSAGKITESALTLVPIQMGARVYIPLMGRFTSVDPQPGSLPNLYTYPLDPINLNDLSGASLFGSLGVLAKTIASVISVAAAAIVSVIRQSQTTSRAGATKPTPTVAAGPPPSKSKPSNIATTAIAASYSPSAVPKGYPLPLGPDRRYTTAAPNQPFDLINGLSTGSDYAAVAGPSGALVGCGIGGTIGSIVPGFGTGVGCLAGGAVGETIGALVGAVTGFFQGGYSNVDPFNTGAPTTTGPDYFKP
jgi:RHS repeat-associated protein